jgi:hypothetical protein
MRRALPLLVLSGLLFAACQARPDIHDIDASSVVVHVIAMDGAETAVELNNPRRKRVASCIPKGRVVKLDNLAKEALQEGEYRIRFTDAAGDHEWTLLNSVNATDGERYYRVDCLYDTVGPQ